MLHFRSKLTTSAVRQSSALLQRFYLDDPVKIIRPKRINRTPTDILYALSATVGRDPTAAHYKYHDDPYLIPASNVSKRAFALAQESGRKSARWILQENRNLFDHMVAEPPVKEFMPQLVFTEESEVDVKTLKDLIDEFRISDAITVFNLLDKKGAEVEQDTLFALLQLVCFYNHEEPLDEEWIEERWFQESGSQGVGRRRMTWKDYDLADQLFNQLKEQNSAAYNAVIQGMAKYFHVERAYALFDEALDKGVPLEVGTFNSIIDIVEFAKSGNDARWDAVKDILSTMNRLGVRPNLGTLNSVLKTIGSISLFRLARQYTLQVLSEFKSLDVEPSLATWYHVLNIFCREKGAPSHVLADIMNQIENKEFNIRDPKDTNFFVTAMTICHTQLNDRDLANRVHQLLLHGENYNLMGNSYKETVYYRHYLTLICNSEPFEVFFEHYNRLVPNIYTPEPGIMINFLNSVELGGAFEHLPLFWSHMVIFEHIRRENIITHLLQIMVRNPLPEHAERFSTIAGDVWTRLNDIIQVRQERKSMDANWSGFILGDILLLHCRAGRFEPALQVFTVLDKSENQVVGEPNPEALTAFAELCVKEQELLAAIDCLEYAVQHGLPENLEIAASIKSNFTLDKESTARLNKLGQTSGKSVFD